MLYVDVLLKIFVPVRSSTIAWLSMGLRKLISPQVHTIRRQFADFLWRLMSEYFHYKFVFHNKHILARNSGFCGNSPNLYYRRKSVFFTEEFVFSLNVSLKWHRNSTNGQEILGRIEISIKFSTQIFKEILRGFQINVFSKIEATNHENEKKTESTDDPKLLIMSNVNIRIWVWILLNSEYDAGCLLDESNCYFFIALVIKHF